RKNLDVIKKQVSDLGGSAKASDLRNKLNKSSKREKKVPAGAPSQTCHFCAGGKADPSFEITVPLHDDGRKIPLLFGEGTEYQATTITVSRCPRCAQAHKELPLAQADWSKQLEEQGRPEKFPDLSSRIQSARKAKDKAAGEWKRRIKEANREEELAASIKSAQAELDTMRTLTPVHIVAISLAGLAGMILGAEVVSSVLAGMALAIGAAIGMIALIQKRLVSPSNPASARLRKLKDELEASKAALAKLEAERDREMESLDKTLSLAESALEEARTAAKKKWEANHPKPSLDGGIRPEQTYLEAPEIVQLRTKKWSLGPSPASQATSSKHPNHVTGLMEASA
ncbi:MAG TPA: hypothetical protein PKY05_16980, partial [Fibrobacteria bacterium]|nr:hypothetical protein [Fibrobacteria bacterium]